MTNTGKRVDLSNVPMDLKCLKGTVLGMRDAAASNLDAESIPEGEREYAVRLDDGEVVFVKAKYLGD